MGKTAVPPITVNDYRQMPEGPPYFQLIEGDLFMSPSPKLFHQGIVFRLANILGRYLDEHPVGAAFVAPSDVVLSDINVFQPDLYFVANARKSILSEQGAEAAPDLVIEILSAGTEKHDRGTKRKVYARCGVKELWLVDPERFEVVVYRFAESSDAPIATLGRRQLLKSPVLPGLRLKVGEMFRR